MKQLDLMSLLQRVKQDIETVKEEEEHELHVWRRECPEPDDEGMRACAYVSCRHHLAIEVRRMGSVASVWEHPYLMRDGELQMNTGAPMCSLDIADRTDLTDAAIGWVFCVGRERVRQLIDSALHSMREALGEEDVGRLPKRPRASFTHHEGVGEPRWLMAAKREGLKAIEEGRGWTCTARTKAKRKRGERKRRKR